MATEPADTDMPRKPPVTDDERQVRYRCAPQSGDIAATRRLVVAAQVFSAEEREVALELLEERMLHGEDSGYQFIFADLGRALIGYAAWGAVPMTACSYDLYWIVVDPGQQHRGVGRGLLERTERAIAARGGGRLYIETSSREPYRRTRRFYAQAGYLEAARLAHFYAPGDAKVVFCKPVAGMDSCRA
jgi:GNAT superfamily N-acetyltransferase